MARGAWLRATTPIAAAFGDKVDPDPFGLFADEASSAVAPYDPVGLQALQDSIGAKKP